MADLRGRGRCQLWLAEDSSFHVSVTDHCRVPRKQEHLGVLRHHLFGPLPRLDGEVVSSTMWDCQLEVSYTPLVTKSGRSTDCEPQGAWVGPCLQRGEGWGWALAGEVLREHKSAADKSQQLVK